VRSHTCTVTSTASLLIPPDNKNRQCYIHNPSGGEIYVGDSTVTTGNGFHIPNNTSLAVFIPANESLYAVTSQTSNVFTLTPDID